MGRLDVSRSIAFGSFYDRGVGVVGYTWPLGNGHGVSGDNGFPASVIVADHSMIVVLVVSGRCGYSATASECPATLGFRRV